MNFPSSPGSSMMFEGLMSRWISSSRWAAWIPSATCCMIRTFCSIDIFCSAGLGPGRSAILGGRDEQGLALDELHGDVGPPLQLADVVHPAHVLVVDLRLGLGFAQEALDQRGVVRPQELQGDRALERPVVGAVDRAHPAVADQVAELVAFPGAEARPGGGSRLRPRIGPLPAALSATWSSSRSASASERSPE